MDENRLAVTCNGQSLESRTPRLSTTAGVEGLVSVIVPAYRADRFIEEALVSIRCQTYPDWELIVVEDSEEGQASRLVSQFAASVPGHQVTYICHGKNFGPSAARNTAIDWG